MKNQIRLVHEINGIDPCEAHSPNFVDTEWVAPKRGETISPFQQAYQYYVLDVIEKKLSDVSGEVVVRITIKLTPKCSGSKLVFEQQHLEKMHDYEKV